MAKEKISGIYCIQNNINNKKYIGKSNNIYYRWCSHKSTLRKNKHYNFKLQEEWNTYGEEKFDFIILEKCEICDLDNKEIFYINKHNSFYYDDKIKNGYNLTTGGDSQGEFTEEKIKVSRECQKSNPIYQIDLNGDIINKWEHGAREASKKLNILQSCIWNCLEKKRRTYKNYIWVYVKEYNKDNFKLSDFINVGTQSRIVLQYDLNGKYIKRWNCIHDVDKYGFDSSAVAKVCKRKYKHHKNYIWCYAEDIYIDKKYLEELHKKDYICAYDHCEKLLHKCKKQSEMAKIFGLSASQISGMLNGKLKSNRKNIIFKYSS